MKYTFFFLVFCLLPTHVYSQNGGQGNQIEIGDSNHFVNTIIVGGDYYGLDSDQLAEMNMMENNIDLLIKKMGQLAKQVSRNEKDKNTILSMSEDIRLFQIEVNKLKHINDSIVRSADKDSLFYYKLERYYEQQLSLEMADFWESHPAFDPQDKMACLRYLENDIGKLENLYASTSQHILEFRRCNACVRQYPSEWLGVKRGGTAYYFNGRGLNYLGAPPSKSVKALALQIPNYGSMTIAELQERYRAYWSLKHNKSKILNEQYSQFIKNPRQSLYDIVAKTKPCQEGLGDLKVYNRLGERLTIWLCKGASDCSLRTSKYKITIEQGRTGDFLDLPQGSYNYNTYRGSGLLYPYAKGQVRLTACKEQELIIE